MSDDKPIKAPPLTPQFPTCAGECNMEDAENWGFITTPSPNEHFFRPVRPAESPHSYE